MLHWKEVGIAAGGFQVTSVYKVAHYSLEMLSVEQTGRLLVQTVA